MKLSDLLRSIDGTNNGYLFVPTKAELDCARAHPQEIEIRGGGLTPFEVRIGRRGFVRDLVPRPASTVRRDLGTDFDYEGAILARQERYDE